MSHILWAMVKGIYYARKNRDEFEELTEDMRECENCELGVPCEDHEDQFLDLAGGQTNE